MSDQIPAARYPRVNPNVGEPERREWVYVQRPRNYQISGCQCGNEDPDWSEFKGMLWCATCEKDFKPEHDGIFGGPIPVNGALLMGIDLRRFNLTTQQIEEIPNAE